MNNIIPIEDMFMKIQSDIAVIKLSEIMKAFIVESSLDYRFNIYYGLSKIEFENRIQIVE